jgi:hypothetical protein
MSEPFQFWLDNKMSAGLKVAGIGDQALVVYREKFYVVEKEAAQTRGGKALRYSRSSLPVIWKKALLGESPSAEGLIVPADDALPTPTTTKRERPKQERIKPLAPARTAIQETVAQAPPQAARTVTSPRSHARMNIKPVAQTSVAAICPECNFKHEIPLEKGKNGKPFITACARCKADFAVRFVPATIYQAQVAGFR